MAYQLTQNVIALSVGFQRGKGNLVGRSELPSALFESLLDAGVIVDTEAEEIYPPLYFTLSVSELKKLAKERGIPGYSRMKKTELVEALS